MLRPADIASVENGPVFSSGPYANRRCIAFASWEDCRESRNPEVPKGAVRWCNETSIVFRGLPMHPTTETGEF